MKSASIDFLDSLYRIALSGGAEEENTLFEALSARFRVIAANRIWDRQDALDVAQDALAIVHHKYKGEASIPSFTGWAHTIMQHKVLEYFRTTSRRNARFPSGDVEKQGAAASDHDPDLDRRLKRCLRELIQTNRRYGRILVCVYQGYSPDEICYRLEITRSNFYTILSRARSLLKQCLGFGDTKP